jgi:hypothetical protein
VSNCSSCAAPIYWAESERGTRIPIVREPSEKGNIRLRFRDPEGLPPIATYLTKAEVFDARCEGEALFLSHFADCPFADQHRRKR